MKKWIIVLLVVFCVAGVVVACFSLGKSGDGATMGTWWWNDRLDADMYLNFASKNNVNEIYFCTSRFNELTAEFICRANEKNIQVYWLAGEFEWLEDCTDLLAQIDKYIDYQRQYSNAKFSGIHLDIEPHQSPDFGTKRSQLIYNLIDLASTLYERYPDIKFDYDLPFWLHDEITYNNQTKPAYEFLIDIANRVFVMSYRDSANAILDIAKEEISYAKAQNKQLVLCVETHSTEGDKVSFQEEGKMFMMEEINKLKKEIPNNFGIAIHHIKTWQELKD